MRIRFSILFIAAISISTGPLCAQGHKISIHIPDLTNADVILAHRLGLKFYTDDTVKTDNLGKAVFSGSEPMLQGMYQLVFPEKKYVEFFVDKNQTFGIYTLAAAPAQRLSFSNSPENSLFLDWQVKYANSRNRISQIQKRMKSGNVPADSMQLFNKELQQIQLTNNQIWDSAIDGLAGTLPGNFIRGLKPVSVPDSLGKTNTPEDQEKQYLFVKRHFFDGIDFTDDRLLRTPLIETKLDQYFKQLVPPVADSIIRDAQQIIERAKPSKDMFQFVVQYLFNLYSDPEIMGTDAVYVFIAENYYMNGQAPWIDSANLRGITYRVKELKPLLLGAVGPELTGLTDVHEKPADLKDFHSKYLVLYFWSPDCGFCKEATPKLFKDYESLKQSGAEVIAINTRLEKELWLTFIADHQLTWINLYNPGNVRDMLERYQAFATPVIYILDQDRRIIAKNISVDQVKPFLTQYQARQ